MTAERRLLFTVASAALALATLSAGAIGGNPSWVVVTVDLQEGPLIANVTAHHRCLHDEPCFLVVIAVGSKGRSGVLLQSASSSTEATVSVGGHTESVVVEPARPFQRNHSISLELSSFSLGDEAYLIALASGPEAISDWTISNPSRVEKVLAGPQTNTATFRDFETPAQASATVTGFGGSVGTTYEKAVAVEKGLFGVYFPSTGQPLGTTGLAWVESPQGTIRCTFAPFLLGKNPLVCIDMFTLAGPRGGWDFRAIGRTSGPEFQNQLMLAWVDAEFP